MSNKVELPNTRPLHEAIPTKGYRIVESHITIHDSPKHGFFKLEKDGAYYFAKYSKNNATRPSSITKDIWWCKYIEHTAPGRQLGIRTPHIVDSGSDWYVATWINGQPSVAPHEDPAKLEPHLQAYVNTLIQIDTLPAPTAANPDIATSGTPSNDVTKRWQHWSARPLQEGVLAQEQLDAARALTQDYAPYVTPRLQHGDFTPWHMLVDEANQYWLIDGEHTSTQTARYYDLAYIYSRVFTRMHSKVHAQKILALFIEQSQQDYDTIYPAFLPVLTSRAIGMHLDALNDLHTTDYRHKARDLLQRCLSREPQQLLG